MRRALAWKRGAGGLCHAGEVRSSQPWPCYLMAVTSLPASVPATEVLAAYRLRWQIELAFKRLKGLLGCNRLPVGSAPVRG